MIVVWKKMTVICPCHDNGPKANLKAARISPSCMDSRRWRRRDGSGNCGNYADCFHSQNCAAVLVGATWQVVTGARPSRFRPPDLKIVVEYDETNGLTDWIADASHAVRNQGVDDNLRGERSVGCERKEQEKVEGQTPDETRQRQQVGGGDAARG